MKREFETELDIQDELRSQLNHALQGGILLAISKMEDGGAFDLLNKAEHEAHNFRVNKNNLPKLFEICQEVVKTLDYHEPIDFYLVQDSRINACAHLSDGNGKSHIIEINSGLYNIMDKEELKYIIGHEVGHLIHFDGWVDIMVGSVYPKDAVCPLFIKKRYDLYNLVAELSADRCGYMANKNLNACITAIYKIMSGIDLKTEGVTIKALIRDNEERLSFLQNEKMAELTTHPHGPIRIKALRLFAEAKTDEELDKEMEPLIDMLKEFGKSKTDEDINAFIASAGLMMASADNNMSNRERSFILERLGERLLAPVEYINKIENKDIAKVFETSVKRLLKEGKEIEMLSYVIELALADGKIEESELGFIFDFGNMIKMPKEIVIRAIAENIRQSFKPTALNLEKYTVYEDDDDENKASDNKEGDAQIPNEESEEEVSYSYAMCLTQKFTDREYGLVICGIPEGDVHVGDEIILLNSKKEIRDIVTGVVFDRTIHDEYVDNGTEQEIGLILKDTSSRSINGTITDWLAIVE